MTNLQPHRGGTVGHTKQNYLTFKNVSQFPTMPLTPSPDHFAHSSGAVNEWVELARVMGWVILLRLAHFWMIHRGILPYRNAMAVPPPSIGSSVSGEITPPPLPGPLPSPLTDPCICRNVQVQNTIVHIRTKGYLSRHTYCKTQLAVFLLYRTCRASWR